jgi:hypothetical protein
VPARRARVLAGAECFTEGAFKILGGWGGGLDLGLTGKVGLVAKLVWRVKLVAELRPGVMTEIEVARIERDEQSDLADLGFVSPRRNR